jgi:hypothetical protein
MGMLRAAADAAIRAFRAAKIMTLVELSGLFGRSGRTVHRRLHEWGAISSYNCNGRYYCLPEVAQFDEHGLWRFRCAAFSRHGTLTDTVAALVRSSANGLTASDLEGILGVGVQNFIARLCAGGTVGRFRHDGRFVYVSPEPDAGARQREARTRAADSGLPSDAEAVLVLAEIIRRPDVGVEEVARVLAARGTPVGADPILRLLERHGLAKKGAPDSARSGR